MQEPSEEFPIHRAAGLTAAIERLNEADRRAAQARSDAAARGEHLTDATYRPLGDVAYDFSTILGFPISLHVAEKLFHAERTWKLPPVTRFTPGRKYERRLGFPISRDLEVRLHVCEFGR
jgi:hypothetical protein